MKRMIRIAAVFGLVWGLLALLAEVVRLAPGWPSWGVALGVALTTEAIIWLYRYERGAVSPVRSRWILGLRLAAMAVLVWILIEPSWVRTETREPQPEVVIVIDDSASMHLTDEGKEATRQEIGTQALAAADLEKALKGKIRVRTVRAARSVRAEGEITDEGWNQATDLVEALGTVLEQTPPDELGGVVLVSDGRHNRPGRVEDVARRFGILDAPIAALAVGSADPPRDAAVLSVNAPEAIHLGDRMRVSADLKFDGYKGATAKVMLKRGGEIVEEQQIPIPQENHREEIRFVQIPEADGVGDYMIEIAELEGERFDNNNRWEFETSITDARTNVLLIDGHPRWEFRYLRNLFYGRDKSIHLQWMLLHPDRIEGQENPTVAASASRPFGEAQATALPENEEEWRKFDVIILGDISPDALDDDTWEIIDKSVSERGAMLVMIAGPEFMPHAIVSETGRELVPVEVEWGARTYFGAGGDEFRIGLTPEGSGHPITRQDTPEASSEQVWASFPPMRWRHPLKGVKDGAEILMVVENHGETHAGGAEGLNSALEALAQRREREAEAALLVTRQAGRGKVAMLMTDRTWRLRQGAGDVFHHRFWGNLMRWGAGPVLRAGGERVRIGTDQLTYTPDDKAEVTVRLRDTELNPVSDKNVAVRVMRDGKLLETVALSPVDGSHGLHQGKLGPYREAGRYTLEVGGARAEALIAEDEADGVEAGFRVVGSRGPIELADTTLNLPLLQTVADLSGGRVLSPDQADELAAIFLGTTNEREEIRETSFWDHWSVLALLALLLAAEWIARRAGGLP